MTGKILIYALIALFLGGALAALISALLQLPEEWAMLLGMMMGGGFAALAIKLADRP